MAFFNRTMTTESGKTITLQFQNGFYYLATGGTAKLSANDLAALAALLIV